MTPEQLRQRLEAASIPVTIIGLVRETDVARILSVTPRTLSNYRRDGLGPTPTLLGNKIWYSVDSIAEFIGNAQANSGNARKNSSSEAE